MTIFAINIVTVTKNAELYDAVAVNKFPCCICADDEQEFYETLKTEQVITFVRESLKSKYLFDNAMLYVRMITDEGEHKNITLSVREQFTFDN